ncbi:MAG TPA: hypothetical protein VIJ92_02420 [Ginsengibacter sp.]
MRYALERLDLLITVTVNPKLIIEKEITDLLKQEWISKAEIEKENIRLFLMRKAFKLENEKTLELLIQQYQASVIVLLDTLFTYANENNIPDLHDSYTLLLKILEDTLSNIGHRYAKYFNQDDKVPDIYLQLSKVEIDQKIKPLKKRLKQREYDENLVELTFASIHAFTIIKAKNAITYRRLMYIKNSITALEELARQNTVSEKGLMELLVYINFNCSRFVSYCINMMDAEINNMAEQNEKLDKLTICLKKISQMQEKPAVAFKQKNESVKSQILTWIHEEIYFLEQKQRFFSPVPYLKEDSLITDEQRLHLSASVDVLTLLARSAKDSKLILNKEMAGMFRNISKFCRTKNAEHPSPTSMLNKSYVAERSSKKAAIDILHEMIKNINRYCVFPVFLCSNFLSEIIDVVIAG